MVKLLDLISLLVGKTFAANTFDKPRISYIMERSIEIKGGKMPIILTSITFDGTC